MKSTRMLSIAVLLLLITNLVLVAFMVLDKKKPAERRRPGPRTEAPAEMVKALNMSDAQQQEYKKLKEEHFKTVQPYFDSLRISKAGFFELAKQPDNNDSLVNAFSARICAQQSELDKLTLAHYRKIRLIFSADQQPKYDSLLKKFWSGRGKRDSSRNKTVK